MENLVTTDTQRSAPAPLLTRLTGEKLLYGAIFLLAVGLRLAFLDWYPLTPGEAEQALVAYDLLHGELSDTLLYSPLVVSLNTLGFFLFGASETSARLGLALAGSALVLLPFGLRAYLGRWGALFASLFLATSAVTLFTSRTVSGDLLAGGASLMLFVGTVLWFDQKRISGLYLAGLGLFLLPLTATSGFTALLILLLLAAMSLATGSAEAQEALSNLPNQPQFRPALAVSAGVAFVLGSAGLLNITGLAAISELFNQWLGQFSLGFQAGGGLPAVYLLLAYEPVLLVFGLAGVALAFVTRNRLDWALSIWLGLALILDTFMGGRSSGQVVLAVVPLALLAGRSSSIALLRLWHRGRLDAEGLFLSVGLVVSVFTYITLTTWTKCVPARPGCELAWILPLAGLGLLVGLVIVFWAWYDASTALTSLALLTLLTLGVFSLGQSWRLSFAPLNFAYQQAMFTSAPTTEQALLTADLTRLSLERTGDRHTMPLAVIGEPSPQVRWLVRDFRTVDTGLTWTEASGYQAILGPAEGEQALSNYLGETMALTWQWSPLGLRSESLVRWYLFRQVWGVEPAAEGVVLWVLSPAGE